MADKTAIAWTDKTFNALWGCVKVSPGCTNCYAATLAERYGQHVWGPRAVRRTFGDKHWREPLKWNREAHAHGRRLRVFCGSMFDWREDHPQVDDIIPRLHWLWRETPLLDWQMLTKRPERIREGLPEDWGVGGYPNVWLGTSIENIDYGWRAKELITFPAVVRFISYEPALGSLNDLDLSGLDWVIYGGESGPGFRPEDKQWARDMHAKCAAAKVAFFHKQSSGYRTELGIELDGKIVREYPTPRTPPHPLSAEAIHCDAARQYARDHGRE